MAVTVTRKGQATIPKPVRNCLGSILAAKSTSRTRDGA
jgi:hypothetical protein